MSGKGSKPRPYSVTQKQFANNWDKIFNQQHINCGTDECCMRCDTAELPSAVDDAAMVMVENAAKKG